MVQIAENEITNARESLKFAPDDVRQSSFFLNGKRIDLPRGSVHLFNFYGADFTANLEIADILVATELLSESWTDFPREVNAITIENLFYWLAFPHSWLINMPTHDTINGRSYNSEPGYHLTITHLLETVPLDAGWSFVDYCNEFARRAESDFSFFCRFNFLSSEFVVQVARPRPHAEGIVTGDYVETQILKSAIEPVENRLRELHQATILALETTKPQDAISLRFDFPESVKVPCEQYLLYFAQFLKDVGLGATAEITEIKGDAGGVLFTVTPDGNYVSPDNPDEALDKIRQALGVYLRLPANPVIIEVPMYNQPVEVQALALSVQNLNMQLGYANLREQALLATVQQQQVTLGNLAALAQPMPQPITGQVLVDSVRAIVTKDSAKDKETTLGGAVELGNFEQWGATVKTGVIFRWLKNLLFEFDEKKPVPPTDEPKQITAYGEATHHSK